MTPDDPVEDGRLPNPEASLPLYSKSEYKPTPEALLLLNLPNEILHLIGDALDPASGVCLSLTCKKLSWLLSKLQSADLGGSRKEFLLLLEKDEGDRFVYCCFCNGIHYFPLPKNLICANTFTTSPRSGRGYSRGYGISFPEVRALMNHHLSGGRSGLPLSHADLKADVGTPEWGPYKTEPHWERDRSARVIDGELYLRVTHTLSQRGQRYKSSQRYLPLDDEKLELAARRGYNICLHVYTGGHRRSSRHAHRITSLDQAPEPHPEPFVRCWDRVGSCDACYTDYDLTIENKGGWVVTIRAYHKVGAGREPTEAPWACGAPEKLYAVYGAHSPLGRADEYLEETRPLRRNHGVPPGYIKRTWLKDVAVNG